MPRKPKVSSLQLTLDIFTPDTTFPAPNRELQPAATTLHNHPDYIQPFIKWVGGKRALTTAINARAPSDINTYWEPFVGGGAVFFSRASASMAQLSDLNSELTTTYLVVKQFPEQLITELAQHALDHADDDHYYRVRKMTHLRSPISVAARFIYLNKTCYNGLYRVNQKGTFNVAKGSYKNPAICDAAGIRAASKALQNAEIQHRDFGRISPAANDFVYCDPPHDGTYAGYTTKKFGPDQQQRLRDLCLDWHRQGANVMVSNSDSSLIRTLYSQPPFHIDTVSAPRYISAKGASRGNVTELMITTYQV